MKTIEERAEEACVACSYGELDHDLLESCFVDGFFAGAKSEREELLRWRDPKEELPEERRAVLVKTDVDINIGFYFGHGEFSVGDIGTGLVDRKDEDEDSYLILGWRPIVELPEVGEK